MIIKKYQGKTKEEAWNKALAELGDGIVEMNAKMVKAKGPFSIFKSSVVELTVAKEEEQKVHSAVAGNSFNVALDAVSPAKIIPMREPAKVAVGQENVEIKVPNQGSILEEKIDNLQNLIVKQMEEKNKLEEEKAEQEVKEEAKDKRMVNLMKLLYNKMLDNEMDEKYANEIIDEISKNYKSDASLDMLLSEIYQRMILKMGKPYVIEDAKPGPKVIFFVGPTGVGKTTTIAKIASTFRIEQKKKIALLTADTYRIAAAEQLRTYANILQVPFRVVYSSLEITSAIDDYRGYDYILVDTTGHSPNNEAQRESMNDLIGAVDTEIEKEVFLVLSASTKYKDLMRTVDKYKDIPDYKLIFTKLDETSTLGNIYNIKMYTGAPLSYVTCGQNVPDDIEYFNPQATVKQLLGGKR